MDEPQFAGVIIIGVIDIQSFGVLATEVSFIVRNRIAAVDIVRPISIPTQIGIIIGSGIVPVETLSVSVPIGREQGLLPSRKSRRSEVEHEVFPPMVSRCSLKWP
jgi:hypothetical protein